MSDDTHLLRELSRKLDALAGQGTGKTIDVRITRPANATPYTAVDVVNDVAGLMLKVPGVARYPGGSFWVNGIEVIGDQAGGVGAETWQPIIWLWKRQRYIILADNSPHTFTYTIERQAQLLGVHILPAIAPLYAAIAGDITIQADIARHYDCAPDSKDIYFDLQTNTAFTPSSGALYLVKFHITQD